MEYHYYRCKHCGRKFERQSDKRWIKTVCEETGITTHAYRLNPVAIPLPSSTEGV